MQARPQPEMMRLILDKIKAKGYAGAKETDAVSSRLRIPSSRVYGFLSQFKELPRRPWRARIRVCTGPVCAAAGAWAIYEDLRERAPAGVEVLAEPGMLRWHAPPAVSVEIPGVETTMAGGLAPQDIDALVSILGEEKNPPYGLARDAAPPHPRALAGHESSPWTAAAETADLPEAWGPEMLKWAAAHKGEAATWIWGGESAAARGGGMPAATVICDAVGTTGENSLDLAACLLHPRAVVAGSALAAAALGSNKVVFYCPWNEPGAAEAMAGAAAELFSGTGIRHSVFKGPAHLACERDIGRAAVIEGMMLWQAASLYGWSGTRAGDPPYAVIGAAEALRIPWLIAEDGLAKEGAESLRFLALSGGDAAPLLLEAPLGSTCEQICGAAGLDAWKQPPKAVYSAGGGARGVAPGRDGGGVFAGGGNALLLDSLTCMPLWAQYLARGAERDCCGGCVPGRTAPSAAARIIGGILRGEAEEEGFESLEALLADSGELALCPRLRESSNPVLACLREFRGEFEEHGLRGTCTAGSCAAAVGAAK